MPDEIPVPKQSQSVFLVEAEKIKVNPLQPRREFDPAKLQELAASIRAYGILQPLVVVRQEVEIPTGRLVEYELIAGERRLRAARLAGLDQVPVIIRKEPTDRIKLELALVENIQREDLNPMERAEAYRRLMDEFGMKQKTIAERVGKARESIANTVRLVGLPDYIKEAMRDGRVTEGHARPFLMLSDRPEEQKKLFEEVIAKNATVRYAEDAARRIAPDRRRKRDDLITDIEARQIENKLSDAFGTRVFIERHGVAGGGKIMIDFFSPEDLYGLLTRLGHNDLVKPAQPAQIEQFETHTANAEEIPPGEPPTGSSIATDEDLKSFTI